MKSKELKIYNLPNDEVLLGTIDAKPNSLFFIIFLIGFFMIVIYKNIIYGVILILIALICCVFMPSVILVKFYQDYLVLFNKADKNRCVIIYYEDVVSWYYVWDAVNDELVIELDDGSIEKLHAFSKTTFELYMQRFLKDKKKTLK